MSGANADQEAFWSDTAGPVWVRQMQAMDTALAPVLSLLLTQAALQPGEAVIDIGCGTGTSTHRAAEAVGPAGRVLGADISPILLGVAAAGKVPDTSAEFLLADAQTHSFEPESFDCLISRFGVMFFADPAAAFANMARALRAGGRLTLAAWGPIPDNPYFIMPAGVVKQVFAPLPKSDPDGPGPFSFRDTQKVTGILDAAGLVEVSAQTVALDLTPDGDGATVADLLCDIGPAQMAISHFHADAGDVARLKAALVAGLAPFQTTSGIRIPAAINIFHARKPA